MYNILWLDDEFVNEEGSDNLPLGLIRVSHPNLSIKTVAYVDWCKNTIIQDSKKFHAVILDANGKHSNDPTKTNLLGFEELIELCKEQGIPTYVFSGELNIQADGDLADVTLSNLKRKGIWEGTNLFFKSGGYGQLLEKIERDLDSDFCVFFEYPEILENVLQHGVNKDSVLQLLRWLKNKSSPFPEYVALRRIIYDDIIKNRLNYFFGNIENIDRNYVTEKCMTQWEKSIILFLFKDLINKEVHNWPSNDIKAQEIIANSFLTAMLWYNRLVHNYKKDPNPHSYYTLAPDRPTGTSIDTSAAAKDIFSPGFSKTPQSFESGIVEKDKYGFYHVGNYLLNPQYGERNCGKKVIVKKHRHFGYGQIAIHCESIND